MKWRCRVRVAHKADDVAVVLREGERWEREKQKKTKEAMKQKRAALVEVQTMDSRDHGAPSRRTYQSGDGNRRDVSRLSVGNFWLRAKQIHIGSAVA